MGMGMNAFAFTGPNSHEPLKIGRHITFRRQMPPYTELRVGEIVELWDMENKLRAYAIIRNRAEGLTYQIFRSLDVKALEGERQHLHTPQALESYLQEEYPDSNEETVFLAFDFETYLTEVLDA